MSDKKSHYNPNIVNMPAKVFKDTTLSSGARIIYPFLTYYSRKYRDYREVPVWKVYRILGCGDFSVMIWLKELAEKKYLINPHFMQNPKYDKSVYRFSFPVEIEDAISNV